MKYPIAKPTVIKTITNEVFWLYPEFIMQRPYVLSQGLNVARLVTREAIREAFWHDGKDVSIPIMGDPHATTYPTGKISGNRFHIGCMRFAASQTKIIRNWALA